MNIPKKYIKTIIEDEGKRKKLALNKSKIIDLIIETRDKEYIKSIIEDEGKRKQVGIEINSFYILELIKNINDSNYIKSIIEDKSQRELLGIELNSYDFIELIIATNDDKYIKDIIEDKTKRESMGIELDLYGILSLIKKTNDENYIKSLIEDKDKRRKLGLSQDESLYLCKKLLIKLKNMEYFAKFVTNNEMQKASGLKVEDIVECIDSFETEKIEEFIFKLQASNELYNLDLNKKTYIPQNMTIGIEIESEGISSELILKLSNIIDLGWKCKKDSSLIDGVETISPILQGDNDSISNSIKKVCKTLKILKQNTSERCGGHIHIGADYLTNSKSWIDLIEIWGNCEEIFYLIGNTEGEIPRQGIKKYAKLISREWEKDLYKGSIQLDSIKDLKDFSKRLLKEDKCFGINFKNLKKEKNTIEFRLSNGTINANTWIENINLFGGLIMIAQSLSIIQEKNKENMTKKEKRMLECFEIVKNVELKKEERLEALLEMIVPEEKDIYRRRYQVNSKLLEQNLEVKKSITDMIAKRLIDLKKVNETMERIIQFNRHFGLNTEFISDESVLGYALNNTIYINSSIEQDYDRTNRHELLHFFEDTEEFQKLKEQILEQNKEHLEQIRSEYELRYFGLYSEDEINAGVLDNEIAIDLLIDNSVIEYEDGLKIGDSFLGNIEHELEEKRYLNLTLNNNIKNMNLSKWEKIFVANYYDGKDRIIPQGKEKLEVIKSDVESCLQELYEMCEADFIINPYSPEVIREYENEIKTLKQRGEDTTNLKSDKEVLLQELSEKFSKQLWEEYKHIVDFIKNEDYEPSFKYLMLKETLTKTYKKNKSDEKDKTIIKKRDLHRSIAGHMVLNKTTLDVIYNNLESYDNFANLYFAGLEIFNKTTAEKNGISLEGVETYGKGKWLKFEGKSSNEAEYLKNAEKLASLVKDTPWCTKTLASSQLAQGDFFVFIDNEEKPHIAVKMSGSEIDEIRGIQNGNAQELEENYRDIALSFLENNKDIKNGKEWLEKEEWNKRLIEYYRKIDAGEFTRVDVPGLIHDLLEVEDYRSHGEENSNMTDLKKNIGKIKGLLAEYYECSEYEICTEDIEFKKTDYEVCPYKIIFGNANFRGSDITNLGNLQIIGGDADFRKTKITKLERLQKIVGNADFRDSRIEYLDDLQIIGGDSNFRNSQVIDLGSLKIIGRDAIFSYSKLKCLGKLQTIGGFVDFSESIIEDLGNLQSIDGSASFGESEIRNLGNLQKIGKNVYFQNSQITDLGSLKNIGGNVFFEDSEITNLGNLEFIGGNAEFLDSKVIELGKLENIMGEIDWGDNDYLRIKYQERQSSQAKRKKEELKIIGKRQQAGEFMDFVDAVTSKTRGKENEKMNIERGDE